MRLPKWLLLLMIKMGTTCSKKKVKAFFFHFNTPQKRSPKYLKRRKSIKMLNKCCQSRVQQRKKKSQIAVLQQFGIDFERCLAVFELSILIGIITLKSALETATRHFPQLLIRVIPKECRQMSSSNFLTFLMVIKASYGIIFPANLLNLLYDSLSRNNLKI